MSPNKEEFDFVIKLLLRVAKSYGRTSIVLNSGKIHQFIGGYPSDNHRMRSCCSAMRSNMKQNDREISAPVKGNGASLEIEYFL
ncbi:MAG: HNH endonuclease [Bacteroidia bacterium]